MQTATNFFNEIYSGLKAVPIPVILAIIWSVFALVSVVVLVLTLCVARVKKHDKKPYLHLLNVFTALTLATAVLDGDVAKAIYVSATFFLIGYLFYGLLSVITPKARDESYKKDCFCAPYSSISQREGAPSPYSSIPIPQATTVLEPSFATAQSNVRLEHAISITDKLLAKNLGKGDRQELEKMKGVLYSLQLKGNLSADEGQLLNGHFNSLLKLMAKYNL